MEGKLVHLRVSGKLLSEMKEVSKKNGFSGVSDFLRDSARKNVECYKREEAYNTLRELLGSKKGKIKRASEKERAKWFAEFLEERKKGKGIFKEIGVKG